MPGLLGLGVRSALAGGFGCGGQQNDAREGSAARAGTGASASGAGAGAGGATGKGGTAGADAAGTAGADAAGAAGAAGFEGASGAPGRCENDRERVEGSGFMVCDDGLVHRPAPGACRAYVPSQETVPSSTVPDQDSCTSDADCTERPLGMCRFGLSNANTPFEPNRCGYACVADADCPGAICVCGETHGECRSATCTLDGKRACLYMSCDG